MMQGPSGSQNRLGAQRPGIRQCGVALITALLVVAVATIAAVAMVSRQQVDIRRTGNVLEGDQAFLYGFGIEDWAAQILRRDREKSTTDYLGEDWATVLPPIPIDGGQLSGHIEDLQGRFNLNDLVDDHGKASPNDIALFRRLLTALSLSPELADAVTDWEDADIEPTIPAGAEDPTYLSLQQPYRTANRRMADATELRLVNGFSEPVTDMQTACVAEPQPARTVYDVIAHCVTALPERTAINVNTAPLQVLMALSQGLTQADAQALIDGRGDKGYPDTNKFLTASPLAGRPPDGNSITVASKWFGVYSLVEMGRARLRLRSTLMRKDDGTTRVIARAQETY